MSEINGKATRYNGEPVNYLIVFDWFSGGIIGKVTPNPLGEWSFEYFNDINIGITYVANGCKPITHGPYYFAGIISLITSGYLLLCFAESGGGYSSTFDKEKTTEPTWNEYFSQVMDIGLIGYAYGSGTQSVPEQEILIDQFNTNWIIEVFAFNDSQNTHTMTFEILEDNNNVIAAIKSQNDGDTSVGLWYGSSLETLSKTGVSGSIGITTGNLVFSPTGLTFTNNRSGSFNKSFSFNADISKAKKIRVTGKATTVYTTKTQAGGWFRILPPGFN